MPGRRLPDGRQLKWIAAGGRGAGLDVARVERLAAMSHEERAAATGPGTLP